MRTYAFTTLELVFAIVIIGVLASLAIPRMDRDLRSEARENITSAIRYTQHKALVDSRVDPFDSNWQKELWQIRFLTSTIDNRAFFYTISSDQNQNGYTSKIESAIDPANGKYMYSNNGDPNINSDESPNIFIGKKFGINTISFSGGCSYHHIAFDQLGRPHNGLNSATDRYSSYMSEDCILRFGFATDITPLKITISAETGYITSE